MLWTGFADAVPLNALLSSRAVLDTRVRASYAARWATGASGDKNVRAAREKERGKRFLIEVWGRAVLATNADDGIRAVRGRNPIDPDSVRVADRPDRR